jgi:hypothetical protein
MKTLTTLFALATLCATAYGQTIKALGYNTTNGQVVYSGTNILRMPSEVRFGTNSAGLNSGGQFLNLINGDGGVSILLGSNAITVNNRIAFGGTSSNALASAAATRTNLGIPLPALTNTSNVDMLSALSAAQTIFTVKTNDQTIIDETNATTITDLTFATEPGARYVVTFLPIMEGTIILQMNETNATIYGRWNGTGTGFASPTELTNSRTFSVTDTRAALQVFYVEGGTNAGSISATFRGADTNTTNTIKAGSFLRADKMP